MIDLTRLNDAQRAFVQHDLGPALGVAGPGAGKTHSLTVRCAYLIENGIAPSSILLMTFTNKAAAEMKHRTFQLIGEGAKSLHAGTFHGMAYRSLLRAGKKFFILGDGETHDLINGLRKDRGLTKKDPSAGDFLSVFGRAVNSDEPLEAVIRQTPIPCDLALSIWQDYVAAKKDLGAVDYDDLLVIWRDTLRDDAAFRTRQQNMFRRIMVDEFQDTNPLQMQIIRSLADEESNVVAVGDEWQSIYAFRGATIRNILTFEQLFPGAKRYDMTQNYRSVDPIIAAANRLMIRAKEKLADKVLTGTRGDGEEVTAIRCRNEADEADYVVKQLRAWHQQGCAWHDMAVIYRSSFHALRVELAITGAHMPYVKCGGRKVTESKHIRDLLACLWILVNPKQRVAWQRVLMLIEGIGAKTAQNLASVICASDDAGIALQRITAPKRSQATIRRMAEWYTSARWSNAAEAVAEAWAWYDDFFQEEFGESEAFRESGLKAMYDFAKAFDSPEEFLNEFVLDDDPMKDEVKDRIVLTTIHSVKGREFRNVLIIHANDGYLPSYREESDEEGRRLFYVALTRAKDRAYVTYVDMVWKGDHDESVRPSPFLREPVVGKAYTAAQKMTTILPKPCEEAIPF